MKKRLRIPTKTALKVSNNLRFGPVNIKLKGKLKKTDAWMHTLSVATSTCRNLTTFKMTSRIGDVSIYQLLP
jgi:hypothetical protein